MRKFTAVPAFNEWTPDLTPEVEAFCKSINRNVPVYITVTPEPWAQKLECHSNVDEYLKIHGGRQFVGWQVWESKIMFAAEHHSVWLSDDGELRDITPLAFGDTGKQILFVPDKINTDGSKFIYRHMIGRAKWNEPLVNRYLQLVKERHYWRWLERRATRAFARAANLDSIRRKIAEVTVAIQTKWDKTHKHKKAS